MEFLDPNKTQETFSRWMEWFTAGDGRELLIDLAVAAAVFVVTWCVLWIIKYQVLARLATLAKKTRIGMDDFLVQLFDGIGFLFFFAVALYVAAQQLAVPQTLNTLIRALFLFALVNEVIKVAEKLVVYGIARALQRGKKQSDQDTRNLSSAIVLMVRMALWLIGLLLILSNLGFNVTSLIAGLGVGGLAVSLALQNVFGDIFSSFSILMDKPFEEGDFIIVGEHMGTVKQIGLKSTRIQALQGEEIVIANNELTSVRIQNFKKLEKRRVVFSVGVVYGTPVEKLRAIPGMLKEIVNSREHVQFDRAHFHRMGDFSLLFEVVYYALTREYNEYMDMQQDINLAILEQFAVNGIDIAFPTQTIHLQQQ